MVSKIVTAVDNLSPNPFPQGIRKLVGSKDVYRIRVGDYRVLYNIFENKLIIEIVRVGHRKNIYR